MIEFAWTKGSTLLPWIWNSLFSYFWDIILSSEYRTLNTINISFFDTILFWYLLFLLPIQLFLHTLMYAECVSPTLSFLFFLNTCTEDCYFHYIETCFLFVTPQFVHLLITQILQSWLKINILINNTYTLIFDLVQLALSSSWHFYPWSKLIESYCLFLFLYFGPHEHWILQVIVC